ncbi:MAG: hypothetical protein LBT62_00895, partial [Deltaproteobacteria bacterium]|nr:hypothetical protein [Deltaproteobacteria bacterium]
MTTAVKGRGLGIVCLLCSLILVSVGLLLQVQVMGLSLLGLFPVALEFVVLRSMFRTVFDGRDETRFSNRNRINSISVLEHISKTPCWSLIILTLSLDVVNLSAGVSDVAPLKTFFINYFHPSLWSGLGAVLFLSPKLSSSYSKKLLLPLFLVFIHLYLTLLGHDVPSARIQLAVFGVWALIFGQGVKVRVFTLFLIAGFFVSEFLTTNTALFDFFKNCYWINPLTELEMALDLSLKGVAYQSSGRWGFGAEYLSRLDFARPELMFLNGLSYLTVLAGSAGVMVFVLMLLALFFSMAGLALKENSPHKAAVVLPAWLFVSVDQFFTVILYIGFRGYGLSHGAAFIGGGELGL